MKRVIEGSDLKQVALLSTCRRATRCRLGSDKLKISADIPAAGSIPPYSGPLHVLIEPSRSMGAFVQPCRHFRHSGHTVRAWFPSCPSQPATSGCILDWPRGVLYCPAHEARLLRRARVFHPSAAASDIAPSGAADPDRRLSGKRTSRGLPLRWRVAAPTYLSDKPAWYDSTMRSSERFRHAVAERTGREIAINTLMVSARAENDSS